MMIIEDNAHMSSILRTILQGFGARDVVEARDAETAFEVCRDTRPDLALVDYQLGGLTGLEFTQLIRTAPDSPNQHLPIILVTAHSERSRVMEAINSGINEFVVKPVSARALYGRVRMVIDNPRPFVRSNSYFGPCRRRRSDPNYRGPWRRSDDAQEASI
ncbi:MAG: response regulator [Caulobacterales bacterium]|nr:response regulator [Caulobacterales bacterium]